MAFDQQQALYLSHTQLTNEQDSPRSGITAPETSKEESTRFKEEAAARIPAHDLFLLFTADIIQKNVPFTR